MGFCSSFYHAVPAHIVPVAPISVGAFLFCYNSKNFSRYNTGYNTNKKNPLN